MVRSPVTYFYTANSQFAYLGHQEFIRLVRASGRSVIHKPFRLMNVKKVLIVNQLKKVRARCLSISLEGVHTGGQNIGRYLCQQISRHLTMMGRNSLIWF